MSNNLDKVSDLGNRDLLFIVHADPIVGCAQDYHPQVGVVLEKP